VRESGQSMGLNNRVGKTIAHAKMLISEKESEDRGKIDHFEEGEKRIASLLNLPPDAQLDPVLSITDC